VLTVSEVPYLTVSSETVAVASPAFNGSIGVTSNISWTAASDAGWLVIQPTSGSGDGNIAYDGEANTSTEPRTATVTVTADGGLLSKTITITQSGRAITPITAASVTGFVAPVAGAAPIGVSALNTADANFTITSLSWDPAVAVFGYDTAYTATVVLTANANYKFIDLTPTVNVGSTSAGKISADVEGNTLTFTVSFPATLVVPAPSLSVSPTEAARLVGESVTFTATATSNAHSEAGGMMIYQWYKEGAGALSGQTVSQLILSGLALSDTGTYYCVVYETISGKTSATATSNSAALTVSEISIITDKSNLEAAIAQFISLLDDEGLPILDYTSTSWNAALAAYNAAVLVYNDEYATQVQVNAATQALVAAIGNLTQVTPNLSIDDNYCIEVSVSLGDDNTFVSGYTIQNDGDSDAELVVLAAIYNQRGAMIGLEMLTVVIPKGTQQSGTLAIAIPPGYNPDEVVMKTFIWDGWTWLPVAREVIFGE